MCSWKFGPASSILDHQPTPHTIPVSSVPTQPPSLEDTSDSPILAIVISLHSRHIRH